MLGAISAAATGAQALLGIGQTIGGLFMEKPEIPDYDIPEELYKNMTDAEYWSFMGLPDAQKQQFIDQTMQIGANALSSSGSRRGGLGMVASIADQQRQGARELLSADAAARVQNRQNVWNVRKDVAAAKDKQQDVARENALIKRQERKDMIGAGFQNLMSSFGSAGMMAALGGFDDLNIGDWFKGSGGGSTPKGEAFNLSNYSKTNNSSGMFSAMNDAKALKSLFGLTREGN